MKNKSIYAISGLVPEDEDVVVINIYKLIKYGKDVIRYAWIQINGSETNGIGTMTNEFGELEKEEALIKIHGYMDCQYLISKCTFDEMLVKYQELKSVLQMELDEKLSKSNA